ncbi:hypothetical protein Q8A67_024905 [Cirrhinus molitorella]|uniref:Uncharacterized protein n=1 Tax=Cirrhinus molitorella TaxID=172907 RepID=A0AA88TCB5_9TELE|nr:hypothetical protein Q8A67_024905 [Cirrhinus molitorella]
MLKPVRLLQEFLRRWVTNTSEPRVNKRFRPGHIRRCLLWVPGAEGPFWILDAGDLDLLSFVLSPQEPT